MATGTIKTFRAVSGSQYVFFKSNETEPAGISSKTIIDQNLTDESALEAAQAADLIDTATEVIWKWNGINTNQFEQTPARLHNFTSASIRAYTSASAPLGAYLAVSGVGTGGIAIFLATSSLPSPNFIMEMGIEGIGVHTTGSAGAQYGGAALYASGSGSNYHGFGIVRQSNGTSLQHRFDGSTTLVPANKSTDLGDTPAAKLTIIAQGNNLSGSTPEFTFIAVGLGTEGVYSTTWQTNTPWSGSYGGNWLSLSSSQTNRFGIAVQSGPNTLNPVIRFSYILVRRHPIDKRAELNGNG